MGITMNYGWFVFTDMVFFLTDGPDKALAEWIANRPKGRVCGLGWQDAT